MFISKYENPKTQGWVYCSLNVSKSVCRCFVIKPLTKLWQYTCWVFEMLSYPRRIRGCRSLSSCGSCLSSQWKILKGLFSVWEGWTPGSGSLRRKRQRFNYCMVLTVQGQFAYLIGYDAIILSQSRHRLGFIYYDGFGRRCELRGLLAVTPRSTVIYRRGQEPWE